MEPITHLLTGACLARAGFNRKTAYATVAMTLAAEVPDLDVLWGFAGPVAAFQHHRGWTHTFLGIPFEAAVVIGAIWLVHRLRHRKEPPQPAIQTAPGKAALPPVRWGILYGLALIALLSHLLLDWTNNYGLRPFFPFNPRWYAGSFVFIFEPAIFAFLLIALIAPALFGLVSSEVGVRKTPFRGRGWAIAALIGIVALWCLRYFEHSKALELAQTGDYNDATISRVTADPYPINPFRWQTVAEAPMFFQTATADTLHDSLTTTQADRFYKPPTTLYTLIAKRSWLGEAYLDWSSFPLVTDIGPNTDGLTVVTFRDLRFLYDTPLVSGRDTQLIISRREKPPLSGAVSINDDRRVVRMEMDGRVQR